MKWKLALAQHPMYLLIREDTQCAERTPPWGAPDIESYIDRVRQNLAALDRYPRLKLGYEWSGAELELLARTRRMCSAQMREYAQEGRVQFYNGTYAQPHLQILSSEANLRQFEYGRDTYRELGLGAVTGLRPPGGQRPRAGAPALAGFWDRTRGRAGLSLHLGLAG